MMLTYPLDVIRARLAFQVAGEVVYTGIIDAFRVMFVHEGGVRALYRGIGPTMLGMAPYAGKYNTTIILLSLCQNLIEAPMQ